VEWPIVRRAVVDDVEELLRLRALMFSSMGISDDDGSWTASTSEALEHGLSEGSIVGAVIERDGEARLCGAGILHILRALGSPQFPRGVAGHINSVAVEPESRRHGCGESIIRFLVDAAVSAGVERVELHASREGEGIYRRIGFRDRGGGPELRLEL
jgi:ribosomal protein S18 acetylase RimI-like enzyme